MKLRLQCQLLLVIISALSVGLSAPTFAQTAEVRVSASIGIEDTPLYVAIDRGIFVKHGLDVKATNYPSGVEAINAIIGAKADIGLFGTYPFLSAASKGVPLVFIGHTWGSALNRSQSELLSVVANGKSGIKPEDMTTLKGKKVGVSFGSGADTYIRTLIKEAKLSSESDVNLINVQAPNQPTALANNDIDAMSVWEPYSSVAVATVPGAVRVMHGGAKDFYDAGLIVTTKSFAAEHPDLVQHFIDAYADSIRWVRANLDGAAETDMHWLTGFDLSVLKQSVRQIPFDLRLSKNTLNSYRTLSIPLLVSAGRIKEAFDPEKIMDASFYLKSEKEHPDLYSELPPIPDELRLK